MQFLLEMAYIGHARCTTGNDKNYLIILALSSDQNIANYIFRDNSNNNIARNIDNLIRVILFSSLKD